MLLFDILLAVDFINKDITQKGFYLEIEQPKCVNTRNLKSILFKNKQK